MRTRLAVCLIVAAIAAPVAGCGGSSSLTNTSTINTSAKGGWPSKLSNPKVSAVYRNQNSDTTDGGLCLNPYTAAKVLHRFGIDRNQQGVDIHSEQVGGDYGPEGSEIRRCSAPDLPNNSEAIVYIGPIAKPNGGNVSTWTDPVNGDGMDYASAGLGGYFKVLAKIPGNGRVTVHDNAGFGYTWQIAYADGDGSHPNVALSVAMAHAIADYLAS